MPLFIILLDEACDVLELTMKMLLDKIIITRQRLDSGPYAKKEKRSDDMDRYTKQDVIDLVRENDVQWMVLCG